MRENMTNLDESLDKKYDYTRMPINATPAYVMDEYEFEVASSKHVVRFMKGNVNGKRTSIILFGKRQGKAVLKKYDGISDMRKYLATILDIFREAVGNPNTKMTNRRDGFALIFTYKMFDKVGERFIRMFRMLFNKEYSYSKTTFVSHEENANTFFFWKKGRSFESVFPDALVMDGEEAVPVADEPQYAVAATEALPFDYDFDLAHGIKPTEIVKTSVKTTKKFKIDKSLAQPAPVKTFKQEPNEILDMVDVEIAKMKAKTASMALSPEKLANIEPKKIKEIKVTPAPKVTSIISSPVSTLVNENLSMITDSAEVEKIFAELKPKTFPYIPTMTYDEAVETLIYETVTVYMDSFKNTTPEYAEMNSTTMPVFDYESDKQKLKEAKITIYADGLKTGKTKVSTIWVPHDFMNFMQRNFGYIRLSKYDDMMTGVKLVKSISISQIAKRILVTSSMRQNTEFSKAFSLFYDSELKNIENAYDGLKDMDEMIEKIKNAKSGIFNYFDMIRFFSKVKNSLNPDDFVKLNRLFPDDVRYAGLESTPVAHAKKFVKNWFASGSSYSQAIAHLVADKMGPGTNLDSYWNTINKHEGDMDAIKNDRIAYSAYLTRDYNKDVSQRALNDIYEKTQEILTSKYGENGSVELYRGVSLNHDNLGVYTPGVFESWTNSEKSAHDFSTNVMTARIPISGVWSTYDILKNMFPMLVSERYAEEKEWIVMGGILAKTEIISHKVGSKVTIKSLGEWVLGEDSSEKKEDDEGIVMKIMTPSDPRFKKLLASGKIVLGNPDKGKK